MPGKTHLTPTDLLRYRDDELSAVGRHRVSSHLRSCPACRKRAAESATALEEFARTWRESLPALPHAGDEARTQLLRRMRDLDYVAATSELGVVRNRTRHGLGVAAVLALALALAVGILWPLRDPPRAFLLKPDPELTRGATVAVRIADVCRRTPDSEDEARMVPATVARDVFTEYGIRDAGQRIYELDYLIPPELGGSDDVRNLWPQAYATPVWNAHVKDALEAYLHALVCRGDLSLAAAQAEISADWIAAYRKHFGTDWPAADHMAFLKDEPWED
jgi:hypothetical protein